MLRKPLASALLAATLAGFSTASQATQFNDCITAAVATDLAAKTAFQTALRDLLVREKPGFRGLANLNMDLQIALAQSRQTRLVHLVHTDPSRLAAGGDISQLSNFDWTSEDAARLAQADSHHRKLADNILKLTQRNNGHPQWPELRRYFAEVLATLPEFTAIMANLRDGRRKAEQQLQICR